MKKLNVNLNDDDVKILLNEGEYGTDSLSLSLFKDDVPYVFDDNDQCLLDVWLTKHSGTTVLGRRKDDNEVVFSITKPITAEPNKFRAMLTIKNTMEGKLEEYIALIVVMEA